MGGWRWLMSVVMIGVMVWGMLAGCARRDEPVVPNREARTVRAPVREDSGELGRLALRVMEAPNAAAEADALRDLWQHIARNNLTYDMRAHAVETGRVVPSPTIYDGRVETRIQVFRGKEKLHEFRFIPHDNANLALIGGIS